MRRIIFLPILLIFILGVVMASKGAIWGFPSANRAAYRNDVIGVSLSAVPPNSHIVEDQYLSDAFGFTVVDAEGRMIWRLALRHRDVADHMEQRARELIQNSPGLDLQPEPIRIGSHRGIKIAGAPGVDPSTYIYLTAYDRLYEIVCPEREENVKVCETLLHSLSFHPVIRSE